MSLSILLDYPEDISLSALKLIKLKKSIIKRLTLNGVATISELCKETIFSIPTVTKIISELIEEGIVSETGKVDTAGGRRPFMPGRWTRPGGGPPGWAGPCRNASGNYSPEMTPVFCWRC